MLVLQIKYLLIIFSDSYHHKKGGECDCICCMKVLMMPKIEVIQSLLQVQDKIKRSRERIYDGPLFVKRIS